MGIIRSISNLSTRRANLAAIATGLATTAIGLASLSGSVYADTASGQSQSVGVGLAGSTVSISAASSVTLEVIPSSNGSLGVGKASLSVSTSSDNGYRLYVSGTADPNDSNHYTSLYYDGNSSNTVDKIYGLPSTTPVSFTDTSIYGGNTSSTYNHWGFAVPSDTSTTGYAGASAYDAIIASGTTIDSTTIGSLTWKGISSNYTKVKENNTAGTDTFDVYFGAYVNNTPAPGNYQNTIVYTAFVEGSGRAAVTPTDIAAGDTMTITVDYQGSTINASQVSVRLYDQDTDTDVATCDNINIVSGTGISNLLKLTCTPTFNANAVLNSFYDVSIELNNINGTTLSYASNDTWKYIATYAGNMQDATCSALTEGITYSMTDTRTNAKYLVGKLADSKCWMLQNLYIPDGTTLTSSTSNVSSSYTLPDSSNSTSNWSDDSTAYYYAGFHLDATQDSSVYDGDTTNTGSYFSFVAATAGTGTGSSGNVDYSVCPKGWRLPTSGSNGEFQALYTAYSSNTSNFNTAFKYNATSYCATHGCPYSSFAGGNYWSSTIGSGTGAYCLVTKASSPSPSDYTNKKYGKSVRCVLAS